MTEIITREVLLLIKSLHMNSEGYTWGEDTGGVQLEDIIDHTIKLHDRLEMDFGYDFSGNRVRFSLGPYDGIACRDETIRLQDVFNDELREKYKTLEKHYAYKDEIINEILEYLYQNDDGLDATDVERLVQEIDFLRGDF